MAETTPKHYIVIILSEPKKTIICNTGPRRPIISHICYKVGPVVRARGGHMKSCKSCGGHGTVFVTKVLIYVPLYY